MTVSALLPCSPNSSRTSSAAVPGTGLTCSVENVTVSGLNGSSAGPDSSKYGIGSFQNVVASHLGSLVVAVVPSRLSTRPCSPPTGIRTAMDRSSDGGGSGSGLVIVIVPAAVAPTYMVRGKNSYSYSAGTAATKADMVSLRSWKRMFASDNPASGPRAFTAASPGSGGTRVSQPSRNAGVRDGKVARGSLLLIPATVSQS